MEWEDIRSYSGLLTLFLLILTFAFGHLYDPDAPNSILYILTVSCLLLTIGMSIIWFLRRKSRFYEQVSIAAKELGMDIDERTGFYTMAASADFHLRGWVDGIYLCIDSYYQLPPVSTMLGAGGNNTYMMIACKDREAWQAFKRSKGRFETLRRSPLAEITRHGKKEGSMNLQYRRNDMRIAKTGVEGFDAKFDLRLLQEGAEEAVRESFAKHLVDYKQVLEKKVLEIHEEGLLIRPYNEVEYFLKDADDIIAKAREGLGLYRAFASAQGASAVAQARKATIYEKYQDAIMFFLLFFALILVIYKTMPIIFVFLWRFLTFPVKMILGL